METAGGFEFPVGEQRQAAAVLWWDDDLEAEGLQHSDGGAPDARLVIFRGAAVEEDDLFFYRGERRVRNYVDLFFLCVLCELCGVFLSPPAGKPLQGEGRQRGLAGDSQHGLAQAARQRIAQQGVAQRGERLAEVPNQLGTGDQVVAQPQAERDSPLGDHRSPGAGVDLGDLHAVGADFVAHPAAGAIIHRKVGRGLFPAAETTGLRPGVFGAREQVGHRGHRAGRGADVALDALVERVFR